MSLANSIKTFVFVIIHLEQKNLIEYGETTLPYALSRKYLNANKEWGWQWVFPFHSQYFHATENNKNI